MPDSSSGRGSSTLTPALPGSPDERRRRLESILNSTAEGLIALDGDGRVTLVNRAAAAMLGVEPEALFGRDHHEAFHHTRADGRPWSAQQCAIAEALHDAQARSGAEEVFWRADGTSVPVDFVATPLWDNGRLCGAVVVFHDATERRKAEARALQLAREQAARTQKDHSRRALEQSEERLHLALQAGRLGAWEWDLSSNRMSWSPTLERIHGMPEGSFPGTFEAFQAVIHPEDRERVIAATRRVLDERVPHHVEYRIQLAGGRLRWLEVHGRLLLDEAGQPARMVGVCQDITVRKDAEEAVAFQRALLEAQSEARSEGVLVVSSAGRILSFNRRFVEMWGLEAEVMTSRSDEAALASAVRHVADPEAFLARVRELYASGENVHADEIAMRDGRVFERSSQRLTAPDGTYLGYLWAFRDVSAARPAP